MHNLFLLFTGVKFGKFLPAFAFADMSSIMLPFAQVYESCLENISLVRILLNKLNEKSTEMNSQFNNNTTPTTKNLTTLSEVVRTSRFILFYIIRSSNSFSMDSFAALNNLMAQKNSNSQKNLSNR